MCKKCYLDFGSRRQFASFVDLMLLFLIAVVGGGVIFTLGAAAERTIGVSLSPLPSILLIVMSWLFFAMRNGLGESSVGKLMTGLRTVDKNSRQPMGCLRSLQRNVVTLIPFSPVLVAAQMSRGERLGDGWANSRVVLSNQIDNPVFIGAPILDEVEEEYLSLIHI